MRINVKYSFFAVLMLPVLISAGVRGKEFVQGAFLLPLQQRDSVLVADQLRYGFRLSNVADGTRVIPPEWGDGGMCEGVELLSSWVCDTVKRYKASKDGSEPAKYDIEESVIITSFDEGTYELPAIKVGRWFPDGVVDTVSFESLYLTVKEMPVDTATFTPHDIKGQIRYPLTAGEVLPYVFAFRLLTLVIAAAVCIILIGRRRKLDANLHREPAHIVALRKLDHYRGDRFWADEKQKVFYSGVTDALREYISSRYGVPAMEMTTGEIINALNDKDMPSDLYEELKALFERADYVKFAKMTVSREENAQVVPYAVRFVTETYQTEIEEENKVEE